MSGESPIRRYIEIQGLYDGWSVMELEDGTLVNRWEPEDRRHAATQEWIEKFGPKIMQEDK